MSNLINAMSFMLLSVKLGITQLLIIMSYENAMTQEKCFPLLVIYS